MLRVTVWNEYSEHQKSGKVAEVYPKGLHITIQDFLQNAGMDARTAIISDPEHGLTTDVLDNTDVLVWWGHSMHHLVSDEIVDRVVDYVLRGMGIIFLHSAHYSKPFKRLMGTSCSLLWREAAEKERVWIVEPSHPIAKGLPPYFEIAHEEMYGERFDIPAPDEIVMLGWFAGGEVFRSGITYRRGMGKVFYFQPGHETFPVYHQREIQQVIINAANWAKPEIRVDSIKAINAPALEKLD